MDSAPQNRPIYLTADPDMDNIGLLSHWRTTRIKIVGKRGWQPRSFWAKVLTNRELAFEPFAWREAMPQREEERAA